MSGSMDVPNMEMCLLNVRNGIIIVTLSCSEHLVGIMPHVDYLMWPSQPPAEGQLMLSEFNGWGS